MAKKTIINTIYEKIKDLKKDHEFILSDFCADYLNEYTLKEFSEFYSRKAERFSIREAIIELIRLVDDKGKKWDKCLIKILKLNANYIEQKGYDKYSPEELIEEFNKDRTPSTANDGVTPEMMIMYIYYLRRFNNSRLPFLIDQYKKYSEKIETAQKYMNNTLKVEIPEKLKNTLFEFEMESSITEDSPGFPKDDDYFEQIAKRNGFEYLPEKKMMAIPRGLILFYLGKTEEIFNLKNMLKDIYRLLMKSLHSLDVQSARVKKVFDKMGPLLEENAKLKRDMQKLKKKLSFYESQEQVLKNKLQMEQSKDKDAVIKELKKELNYAYSRIERLEEDIANLEESDTINNEIENNVIIEDTTEKNEKTGYSLDPGNFIVISGGNWNSKSREEMQFLFNEMNCAVEFIPAEDTLRKQDLISNADIVIFDTSRHAHKYYLKIKNLNGNILHISNSNPKIVKEFFNA